jgi:hypothetical protein
MMKKFLFLLVLPLALTGCSTTITNLTSSRLTRSSDGIYRLEAAWRTTEQAVRPETIKPQVMIGTATYEMRPELVVSDRWEAFVPVPAGQEKLRYRFKFNFIRNAIPTPVEDSALSQEFTLDILDKAAEAK